MYMLLSTNQLAGLELWLLLLLNGAAAEVTRRAAATVKPHKIGPFLYHNQRLNI
jgi:hypothetical protein